MISACKSKLKPSLNRNGKAPFQFPEAQPTGVRIDEHQVVLLAFDGPSKVEQINDVTDDRSLRKHTTRLFQAPTMMVLLSSSPLQP